jgi:hypothetical protein
MNVKAATEETGKLIEDSLWLSETDPDTGRIHLHDMVEKIMSEEVSGEKAHRWIGWIQACVCMGGGASLKTLKDINRK